MSRLKGPSAEQPGYPQDRRYAGEHAVQPRGSQAAPTNLQQTIQQAMQWSAQQQAGGYEQTGYAQAASQHPGQHAQAPQVGGYQQAQAATFQPRGPVPSTMPAARAPAYAPQFDRYVPQQLAQAPAAYAQPPQNGLQHGGHQQGYLPVQPEPLIPPPQPEPNFGFAAPAPSPYGYADAPRTAPPSHQQPVARDALAELRASTHEHYRNAPDPRGYDFGNYMPTGAPGQSRGYLPSSPQPQAGAHQSLDQWSGHDPYAAQDAEAVRAAGDYDRAAQGGELQPQDQAYEHDDVEHEEEAPSRGRRGLTIVAALVTAIGIGGALAYGYKTYLAPPQKGGAPPVVRKEAAPAKTKPADPGGKQFANQDSKLLGKLGDDGAAKTLAASAEVDASGVRKVATVAVGRDGALAAPLPPPPTSVASIAPAAGGVPGMILDNGIRPPQAAPPPPPPVAAPPPVAVAPPVTAKAPPPASPRVAAAPQAEAAPAPAAKPAAKPKVRDDLAVAKKAAAGAPAQTAAVAAAAPKAGITGYMAVLASPKSRMDALKTFADLQQKYPAVLSNRAPEVQETDQSARGLGTLYRVMVGPPGSREAANDLCTQIKAAGHGGCWVAGF